MASDILCALYGFIIVTVAYLNGVNGQSSCSISEFWSPDISECVPCSTCQKFPKTPSCNTCSSPMEQIDDGWRLAAISSFSVLAVVLVAVVLMVGVMLHQRRAQRRPLREPIEETTGPLYQA